MQKIVLSSHLILLLICSTLSYAQNKQSWIRYDGYDGPGKGKNIVFVSGDEEYRSEEALPMLAQILAKRYGFTCTVLFSTDPQSGEIDPMYLFNITGLENLQKADLLVLFTRFRELPDAQMKWIDKYVRAGKPVIGLRTATHAFNYKKDSADAFARYDFQSRAKGWEGGFGKLVFGETWVSHHGLHKEEGTRGLINGIEQNAGNAILNGVKDIWTPTDVYTVGRLKDASILIYGQSTSGMVSTAPVNLQKSIMPVAWTRTYRIPGGKEGKAFATTMGAAIDFLNEDLRRLLVNACFWAVGMEKQIPEKANVDFVSEYKPTMFGLELFRKGNLPSKYEMK
ncbi:MAG: ThuA domain-containing protein [Bacteroidota bacterium]|nr:ThuA domain-containing protein [Bacteroidota bacterium]